MSRGLQLRAKRVIDVVVSAPGIVLLAPVLVLIAVCIRLDSPGPVFFTQERAGFRGKRFRMLKFRTMIKNAEQSGSGFYVSQDDRRITRMGRILRRFSFDELPQ